MGQNQKKESPKTYLMITRTQMVIGGKRCLDKRIVKVTDLEAYRKAIREEHKEEGIEAIFFTYEERPLPKEETKLKLTIKYEREYELL